MMIFPIYVKLISTVYLSMYSMKSGINYMKPSDKVAYEWSKELFKLTAINVCVLILMYVLTFILTLYLHLQETSFFTISGITTFLLFYYGIASPRLKDLNCKYVPLMVCALEEDKKYDADKN